MFGPLSGYFSALSSAYQAKGSRGPLFREAEAAELRAMLLLTNQRNKHVNFLRQANQTSK
jgi:hypothetical protein